MGICLIVNFRNTQRRMHLWLPLRSTPFHPPHLFLVSIFKKIKIPKNYKVISVGNFINIFVFFFIIFLFTICVYVFCQSRWRRQFQWPSHQSLPQCFLYELFSHQKIFFSIWKNRIKENIFYGMRTNFEKIKKKNIKSYWEQIISKITNKFSHFEKISW